MRKLSLLAVVVVCLASVACQTNGAVSRGNDGPHLPTKPISDVDNGLAKGPSPSTKKWISELDADFGASQRRIPRPMRAPQPRPFPDPIE